MVEYSSSVYDYLLTSPERSQWSADFTGRLIVMMETNAGELTDQQLLCAQFVTTNVTVIMHYVLVRRFKACTGATD